MIRTAGPGTVTPGAAGRVFYGPIVLGPCARAGLLDARRLDRTGPDNGRTPAPAEVVEPMVLQTTGSRPGADSRSHEEATDAILRG